MTHYSCGLGASRELLGRGDVKSLPECPRPSEQVCLLSETRGIEVCPIANNVPYVNTSLITCGYSKIKMQ